jgi:hypothetical protein
VSKQLQSWEEARSLSDIGFLTAEWLQGRLDGHPCCFGGPEDESSSIVDVLVALNQGGFVTTFSQPAEPIDETGSGQRAAVSGYAGAPLARALASLTLSGELLVFAYEPNAAGGYHVPISTQDHHPFTWCGLPEGPEELAHFSSVLSPIAVRTLRDAWQVVAIDLKWGRSKLLWRELVRVTRAGKNGIWTIVPSPDLGLDCDHVR